MTHFCGLLAEAHGDASRGGNDVATEKRKEGATRLDAVEPSGAQLRGGLCVGVITPRAAEVAPCGGTLNTCRARSGLTRRDPINHEAPGVTLISGYWKDANWRPGIRLVDAAGKILHRWELPGPARPLPFQEQPEHCTSRCALPDAAPEHGGHSVSGPDSARRIAAATASSLERVRFV